VAAKEISQLQGCSILGTHPRPNLCALDTAMAEAWATCFAAEPDVVVSVGSILDHAEDAILSPANSFGFMDGGIDLAYSHCFGWELEERVKATIDALHFGELVVGGAVIVETQHRKIQWLVSAPTMRVPQNIEGTVNVYLAFRAALLEIQRHNSKQTKPIASLLAPALGAGIGGMAPHRVSTQMHAAYREIVHGDVAWRKSARSILQQHSGLLS
jgi:O-acetyl-ADP-ribose deacetylase (regulator of RNase III)